MSQKRLVSPSPIIACNCWFRFFFTSSLSSRVLSTSKRNASRDGIPGISFVHFFLLCSFMLCGFMNPSSFPPPLYITPVRQYCALAFLSVLVLRAGILCLTKSEEVSQWDIMDNEAVQRAARSKLQ